MRMLLIVLPQQILAVIIPVWSAHHHVDVLSVR